MPLMIVAAQNANVENLPFIEFIFRNGAELNSKDGDGNTPLHIAAQNNNVLNSIFILFIYFYFYFFFIFIFFIYFFLFFY